MPIVVASTAIADCTSDASASAAVASTFTVQDCYLRSYFDGLVLLSDGLN